MEIKEITYMNAHLKYGLGKEFTAYEGELV